MAFIPWWASEWGRCVAKQERGAPSLSHYYTNITPLFNLKTTFRHLYLDEKVNGADARWNGNGVPPHFLIITQTQLHFLMHTHIYPSLFEHTNYAPTFSLLHNYTPFFMHTHIYPSLFDTFVNVYPWLFTL